MQDAALFYANKAKCPDFSLPEHFILATLHRAENTDSPERLQSIIAALERLHEKCLSLFLFILVPVKNYKS